MVKSHTTLLRIWIIPLCSLLHCFWYLPIVSWLSDYYGICACFHIILFYLLTALKLKHSDAGNPGKPKEAAKSASFKWTGERSQFKEIGGGERVGWGC
jgi:hypothetical protein